MQQKQVGVIAIKGLALPVVLATATHLHEKSEEKKDEKNNVIRG